MILTLYLIITSLKIRFLLNVRGNDIMGKQKKSIKDINIKKLAIELGYSYLEGKYGYWSNAAGKIISYDSMDNDYLKNCINFIDKGIKELKK